MKSEFKNELKRMKIDEERLIWMAVEKRMNRCESFKWYKKFFVFLPLSHSFVRFSFLFLVQTIFSRYTAIPTNNKKIYLVGFPAASRCVLNNPIKYWKNGREIKFKLKNYNVFPRLVAGDDSVYTYMYLFFPPSFARAAEFIVILLRNIDFILN